MWTSVSGFVRNLRLQESCSSRMLRRELCLPAWSDPHGQQWIHWLTLWWQHNNSLLVIAHIRDSHNINKTLVHAYIWKDKHPILHVSSFSSLINYLKGHWRFLEVICLLLVCIFFLLYSCLFCAVAVLSFLLTHTYTHTHWHWNKFAKFLSTCSLNHHSIVPEILFCISQ